MTNVTRHFVRELDQTNENERDLPCVVRHDDAGGQCGRTATIRMYDILNFCELHGEEVRIGAELEAHQDAEYWFQRFLNPHVPSLSDLVEREIRATLSRIHEQGPSDRDHHLALRRAYPNPPEYVRDIVLRWERDEAGDGGLHPLDLLLDSLATILKSMRTAFEEGEDWLTELLEDQRQETAARAAFALEPGGIRPAV